MKLATYLSATVGASLSIIGLLFKIMHWPFSGIIVFSGLLIISVFAIPMIAIYNFNKR